MAPTLTTTPVSLAVSWVDGGFLFYALVGVSILIHPRRGHPRRGYLIERVRATLERV